MLIFFTSIDKRNLIKMHATVFLSIYLSEKFLHQSHNKDIFDRSQTNDKFMNLKNAPFFNIIKNLCYNLSLTSIKICS